MSDEQNDTLGQSFERIGAALEKLTAELNRHSYYSQVQGGYHHLNFGRLIHGVLKEQQNCLILLERHFDDRIRQLEEK